MPFGIHPTHPPAHPYRVVWHGSVLGLFDTEEKAQRYRSDPGTCTGVPIRGAEVEEYNYEDDEVGWHAIPAKDERYRDGRRRMVRVGRVA
jgi:hypothetical protein